MENYASIPRKVNRESTITMIHNLKNRYFFIVCVICLGVLFLYFYISKLDIDYVESDIVTNYNFDTNFEPLFDNDTRRQSMKLIFYATLRFDGDDFGLGLGSKIFSMCKYKNCYATNNLKYIPIEHFDAVIFHTFEKKIYSNKFLNRSSNQVYIITTQESPMYRVMKPYENFPEDYITFNWSMTYRYDSDVVRPYGIFEQSETNYTLPTIKEVKRKVKLKKYIAWFVSHCETLSQREVLVEKLSKFINVDIYGECGELKCERSNEKHCFDILEKNYLFYLSFENSYCNEYVTEKLFNILKFNVIPIVYGGADYNKVAPPHSVINLANYTSLNDLVKYLNYLMENPEEYLKYFEWKKHYKIDTSNRYVLCNLCEKLNQPIEKKVFSNLYFWWHGNNVCEIPENIKKML